ncbi:zinc-dependent metalloprotease [Candidatus Laterigemmans baculatus]|uniref:zinc-dependent metalloprotease n=1 Tax=Candidatus Laterigemmans baculatus TaxID=2770505 RepID=UPI0013DB1BA9|nr:zinc-dependent metalloprotease [Candidatus Laterigemmans baculatus]
MNSSGLTRSLPRRLRLLSGVATAAVLATFVNAPQTATAAELPPFAKVSEGYEKLSSSDQESEKGLFDIWQRESDAQMLLELPKNFAGKRFFIALTVSSGDRFAGLQSGDMVVEWRRYDNRIALISPNLEVRATGDPEGKASVERLFTDRVLLDMPILAMGPSGGPVIDADNLMVNNAQQFFGQSVQISNPRLFSINRAKVFPNNVELAYEVVGSAGRLQVLHYSFSEVPSGSTFKPRVADERIGYFTTAFTDLGQYDQDDTRVRYINRWNLEKRDPRLKLSPPKEPIRFFVEHTTPVRYRRWVKEGVEYWNKAFEKVGILDAIVVEYQDAQSGAHMEKDPEDVRYNFIRWLNNDIGTAIGPSRVHPETGEILDADIILTDGWIRHFNFNYHDLMPQLAMEGVNSETLAWLNQNPRWDPRQRLARADERKYLQQEYAQQALEPHAGHRLAGADAALIGDDEFDGLYSRLSQVNGYCQAATGRQMDLALTRMNWELALLGMEEAAAEEEAEKEKEEEKKKAEEAAEGESAEKEEPKEGEDKDAEDKDAEDKNEKEEPAKEATAAKAEAKPEAKSEEEFNMLDGMPEWFVGPLLADLVAHEVGHTLGLRHNFKASGVYSLDEINSEKFKGKKTFTASVMDYIPINYRLESGEVQGDYGMVDIGPYDFWAIEYGYTSDEKRLPEILKRCSEPELAYATDEDTGGPDPLARRYDFTKEPLDYAVEQMKLVEVYRARILDKFVKDGDSWAKARRGYELTLGLQMRAVSMMSGWVGGAFVHRDKKGDPGDRNPIEVVPAEQQRSALDFVMNTTFKDEAYGLRPELLARMSVDQWLDQGPSSALSNEATWPIHDRILGIQASTLTMLMNPTTLRRVYDNELRLPADQDTLTLPELLGRVSEEVWSELEKECPENRDDRRPMISSLRRNLQREHLERLTDLVLQPNDTTAAYKPINNLAAMELRNLKLKVDHSLNSCGDKMDAYTRAHLVSSQQRIEQVLSAGFTIGGAAAQQPMILMLRAGQEPQE